MITQVLSFIFPLICLLCANPITNESKVLGEATVLNVDNISLPLSCISHVIGHSNLNLLSSSPIEEFCDLNVPCAYLEGNSDGEIFKIAGCGNLMNDFKSDVNALFENKCVNTDIQLADGKSVNVDACFCTTDKCNQFNKTEMNVVGVTSTASVVFSSSAMPVVGTTTEVATTTKGASGTFLSELIIISLIASYFMIFNH
uniref:UPAR/Ly6 domain-containing protein n=1 Tax=Rhabditophanes sp. KR3021 TaxID=114890 RepID=A0AC35U827_9BILA